MADYRRGCLLQELRVVFMISPTALRNISISSGFRAAARRQRPARRYLALLARQPPRRISIL